MTREKFNKEATELWMQYGRLINEKFGFKNYLIDGKPLEDLINNPSDEKINEFIAYIKEQITMLREIE